MVSVLVVVFDVLVVVLFGFVAGIFVCVWLFKCFCFIGDVPVQDYVLLLLFFVLKVVFLVILPCVYTISYCRVDCSCYD